MLDRGWAPLYGVVSGGLKYVDLPLPELYDLAPTPASRRTSSPRGRGTSTSCADASPG